MLKYVATALLFIAAAVSACSGRICLCLGQSSLQARVRYDIVDIGTLGGDLTFARAVNDRGDVVGESGTKSGQIHAFLWSGGMIRDLGTLGGPRSSALGINSSRTVVGWAETKPMRPHMPHAFKWVAGRMEDLSLGANYKSSAVSINRRGVAAGTYTSEDGVSYACLWDARGMQRLGGQAKYGTDVNAIDDRDNIIGVALLSSSRLGEAFVWRQGLLSRLPVPHSTRLSVASAANRRNAVAGWVEEAQGNKPCIWQMGKRTVFRRLGTDDGEALSVNDSGIIVGEIRNHGVSRAVVWINGQATDLSSGIAQSEHWTLEHASSINSRGQIAGWGMHFGQKRSFLLTPLHP